MILEFFENMKTKQSIKKTENLKIKNKMIPHSTKKEIIDLQAKLNKLNVEELISEALNSANDKSIGENINIDYLLDLKENAVSNFVVFLDLKNSEEIKKHFIKEIDKFKKNANLIINKKDREIQEYKLKYNSIYEENKILNIKLDDYNTRFTSLQKSFKDKEDEIIKLKEKLNFFKDNDKLLSLFYNNFHEKDPIDIVKSYQEKHQGEIDLMTENEDLKSAIKILRQRLKEEREENKKVVKTMKDRIDMLMLEKSELLDNHTDKVSTINYLYKKSQKLEDKNHLLHKMLYQLYNKLYEAFRLDKNLNYQQKYLYLTEEDFNPNIIDDEELVRYIKLMIVTFKPSMCDVLLRETVANANMIVRKFLKNKVNLNLRFDPVATFKELKSFMENREDKIKNLEAKINKYKIELSNNGMYEKKYENIIKNMEEEKINKSNNEKKKESFRKSSKYSSIITKKNSKIIENNVNTNVNNEMMKTNISNIYGEKNKSIEIQNKKQLMLPPKIIQNQNIEFTSTKYNTTNGDNTKSYNIRPKSFSPNIKTNKKIDYGKERILSATNTQYAKKNKYYKDSIYQTLHCLQVNNRYNKSDKDIHYKKIRKITIGKRGNISKENGNQKYLTNMADLKRFIEQNNRLFLYRIRMTPHNITSFSKKIKHYVKVFSEEKTPIDKKIKRKIIGKINFLINKMESGNSILEDNTTEKKDETNKKSEDKK